MNAQLIGFIKEKHSVWKHRIIFLDKEFTSKTDCYSLYRHSLYHASIFLYLSIPADSDLLAKWDFFWSLHQSSFGQQNGRALSIKQISPFILFPFRKHSKEDRATQILFALVFSAVFVTWPAVSVVLCFCDCLIFGFFFEMQPVSWGLVVVVCLLFHITSQLLCMDWLS